MTQSFLYEGLFHQTYPRRFPSPSTGVGSTFSVKLYCGTLVTRLHQLRLEDRPLTCLRCLVNAPIIEGVLQVAKDLGLAETLEGVCCEGRPI